MRDRIGFGLGAVRRVSLKKLFIEVSKGGAQNAIAALVTGVLGGPAFSAAQFLGVLVGRFGIALADELTRRWSEESEARESARLRALFRDSPLLDFAQYGPMRADQRLLAKTTDPAVFDESLNRLRRWVARAGLDLVNAWSHVVAHLDE